MKTGEHIEEAQVIDEKKDSMIPVKYTPDELLSRAIDKGMDLNQLEKLMDLQERWIARIAEQKFTEALSAFQEECPEIVKTKPGYDNKYMFAPLGSIDKIIKPIMRKHGLSKTWKFLDFIGEDKKPKVKVMCIISHVAGHKEITEMTADHDPSGNKNGIHAQASSMSYQQRYTLIGALGLTTADSDDDAKKAVANAKQQAEKPKERAKPTPGQWAKIKDRFQKKEVTLDKLKTMFLIDSNLEKELEQLTFPEPTDEEYTEIMKLIISKKTTLEELVKKWCFTETQRKALEVINDNNKKPKK